MTKSTKESIVIGTTLLVCWATGAVVGTVGKSMGLPWFVVLPAAFGVGCGIGALGKMVAKNL